MFEWTLDLSITVHVTYIQVCIIVLAPVCANEEAHVPACTVCVCVCARARRIYKVNMQVPFGAPSTKHLCSQRAILLSHAHVYSYAHVETNICFYSKPNLHTNLHAHTTYVYTMCTHFDDG
jgi:hypothetical protein